MPAHASCLCFSSFFMSHTPHRLKTSKILFPPGFEPGTFRVWGERDNHYTTETLIHPSSWPWRRTPHLNIQALTVGVECLCLHTILSTAWSISPSLHPMYQCTLWLERRRRATSGWTGMKLDLYAAVDQGVCLRASSSVQIFLSVPLCSIRCHGPERPPEPQGCLHLL